MIFAGLFWVMSASAAAFHVQNIAPPPAVILPRSPTPLPPGAGRVDTFGGPCDDGITVKGERYDDEHHPLGLGQKLWLTVSSPDFEPTLTVFERGKPQEILGQVIAAGNGRRSGFLFVALKAGTYVFRTSAPAGEVGRWRMDYTYGPSHELAFSSVPSFSKLTGCDAQKVWPAK